MTTKYRINEIKIIPHVSVKKVRLDEMKFYKYDEYKVICCIEKCDVCDFDVMYVRSVC